MSFHLHRLCKVLLLSKLSHSQRQLPYWKLSEYVTIQLTPQKHYPSSTLCNSSLSNLQRKSYRIARAARSPSIRLLVLSQLRKISLWWDLQQAFSLNPWVLCHEIPPNSGCWEIHRVLTCSSRTLLFTKLRQRRPSKVYPWSSTIESPAPATPCSNSRQSTSHLLLPHSVAMGLTKKRSIMPVPSSTQTLIIGSKGSI